MKERYRKTIDDYPKEALEKHQNFVNYYNIFFKNQQHAGSILKVTQASISRILSGKLMISLEVARRFEEHTKKKVAVSEIYFDTKEYEYELKNNK